LDGLSVSVIEAILSHPKLVVRDEDSVFNIVDRLGSGDLSYFGLLEFVRFEFVSGDCMKRAVAFISDSLEFLTFGIWSSLRNRLSLPVTPPSQTGRFASLPSRPAKSTINSTIISTIPKVFSVFGEKTFRLLYRGSRDGFRGEDFHRQCDGHPNTLTLIRSTNDSIFGGYTPIPRSSQGAYVSDPSLKSFLFTLKNPHNLPAQIFKQKQADKGIYDVNGHGPAFAGHCDLFVDAACQRCTRSWSHLGSGYRNDTGIDGKEVLTGAKHFAVKEIEVFEVI
jgi:hypothetical protein